MAQNIIFDPKPVLSPQILSLNKTFLNGAIDNQLENFNDYSLYGSEDMFGEESPVKIGDILPVDSGVDVNSEEDMFYSDNYGIFLIKHVEKRR